MLLAVRVREGDAAAFRDLYERVAPALFAWASLRLRGGPFARLEPQDILQEVWLRALGNLGSYDPGRSFRAWLIGIAKNVVLQAHEQRRRVVLRSPGSSSESGLSVPEVLDPATSVSNRLAKDEALGRFMRFVEELPSDDRLLVILCGFEERTCAEAAQQLGISADAATKRWQTLRMRMQANGALRTLALETFDTDR